MQRNIKLILAALLFGCLLSFPYGYYMLVRWAAFMGFGYLGYEELEASNKELGFLYFGLAILFQPFWKIALGRDLWNVVDVIVGIGLLVLVFREKKSS